jgi:hypothetical protein
MFMFKLKKIGALTLGSFVLAFFQNCGQQVGFDQYNLKGTGDFSSQIELIDEVVGNSPLFNEDHFSDDGTSSPELDRTSDVGVDPTDQVSGDEGNQPPAVVDNSNNNNNNNDDGANPPSEVVVDNNNRDNPPSEESPVMDEAPAVNRPGNSGQAGTPPGQAKERPGQGPGNDVGHNSLVGAAQLYRCVVNMTGKSHHIGLINGQAAVDKGTPQTLCMSENACLNIMSAAFDVQEAKFTGYCKNNKAHTRPINDGEALALVTELLE